MLEVVKILQELEQTSGKKDKENILKKNKNNVVLQKVFFYVFNPYYIYGIGKKSLEDAKGVTSEGLQKFVVHSDIFFLLDYLRENNGGSSEAVTRVHSFLNTIPSSMRDWYERIILKDLRIGATEKTINKVWKDLIPVFDVMLAEKYEKHMHKLEGKNIIISTKLDGVRAVIMKDEDGNVKIMSRQGKIFEGFVDIEKEVEHLPCNMAYDGEFLAINTKGLNSKELYKATTKITNKKGIKKGVEFHCFDMIPLNEFLQGKSKDDCETRKSWIATYIRRSHMYTGQDLKLIKEVPVLYVGKDLEMVYVLLNDAIAKGLEGVMVNVADALYECKRTASILKVKEFHTADLEVIGFEEGDGRLKGTLGTMYVDYKGYSVGVGSGFSDSMRDEVWNNQDKYLGKIAEVQYFEESSNDKGGISLRFPTFKHWRFDKNEPSLH